MGPSESETKKNVILIFDSLRIFLVFPFSFKCEKPISGKSFSIFAKKNRQLALFDSRRGMAHTNLV
jgi:hypothetical protein